MSELHQRLEWDKSGERFYHTGVKQGVLYPQENSAYPKGVAWNGLTQVNGNPDGAEAQDLWADNMKYASFRSAESYGGSISAYMWPTEWYECDGYRSPDGVPGMHIGQQTRKPFGLCYRTEVGSDTDPEAGYVLHLVYGATASPSDQENSTMNENPDAQEFSWDYETTPVMMTTALENPKATSYIEIESLKNTPEKMAALEAILYGSSTADARLPLPDEIVTILT
jgi:hypothetical protein